MLYNIFKNKLSTVLVNEMNCFCKKILSTLLHLNKHNNNYGM